MLLYSITRKLTCVPYYSPYLFSGTEDVTHATLCITYTERPGVYFVCVTNQQARENRT